MKPGNDRQHMNFAALYDNCRRAVADNLTSMWVGETLNDSQRDYARQMREIIANIFAPSDAMPLVECLNPYESVPAEEAPAVEALVGDLWRKTMPPGKHYLPYRHQAKAWETLLKGFTPEGDPKSIVVTTGTGSGKTEAFMLPLVQDILARGRKGVQAIFLYPLNALMDDQKERLEKLVAGTGLRYAVYNGNLAEDYKPGDKDSERKISLAKGTTTDENNVKYDRFPNCVPTRKELRDNPPEMLLTNPTMLEYILLRAKDNSLIEEGALRWIVIDETHTYTGAGAAELSMLLRRVMLAYGVSPSQVRFATSSATIGNNQKPEVRRELMRRFISDIAGIRAGQVEVVEGNRVDLGVVSGGKHAAHWNRLFESVRADRPYMPLDRLVPEGETVSGKLKVLEEMCREAPEGARLKVHYFFRVPNNGLFVRLDQKEGGSFRIHTSRPALGVSPGESPLLELSRCKHCGEFVAVARGDTAAKTFHALEMDDSDMFDLEEEREDEGDRNLIFALTRGDLLAGDGNQGVCVSGNSYGLAADFLEKAKGWEVVMNTHNRCPHCGTKLTKKSQGEDEEEAVEETDSKKLMKFRVPVDLVSRWMAPEILDQLTPSGKPGSLHRGQQYISFIDSRQGAARASLRQNMEIERQWLYSRIYHELTRRRLESQWAERRIAELKSGIKEAMEAEEYGKVQEMAGEMKRLSEAGKATMSWLEITAFLSKDPMAETLLRQFVKRTSDSGELDDEMRVSPDVKSRYIQSIMVEHLGKRPPHAASPETMGLFTTFYPQLEEVGKARLPEAVERFNGSLGNEELRITPSDWADLMQVFLDYTVRINESIFLRLSESSPIDIFECTRYETQKNRRRPARKPSASKTSHSRVVRYLAQLMVDDGQAETANEALEFASREIQEVVDALWDGLIESGLLQVGTHWEEHQHVQDPPCLVNGVELTPYRLNVADINFKLYDRAALADTMVASGQRAVKRLRPVERVFKGFSPYLRQRLHPVRLQTPFEEWEPFPLGKGAGKEAIHRWAAEKRQLLWNNQLWNEFGVFSTRLDDIHRYPELFVQAEHTAQVDKIIARKVQEEFKRRQLNILACSTTMEMGVDLGSLELVMMCSVPPMPGNYKQRAGRSGRNDRVRSAAVTLCGSDSIGLRTLYDPMGNVIDREVRAPQVDLQSPQVVQRHVNAFLIRESGVFAVGKRGGEISQLTFHYYTPFHYWNDGGRAILTTTEGGPEVLPKDGLGTSGAATPYRAFNEFCERPLKPDQRRKLEQLLRGTIFEGQREQVVERAAKENKRSRSDLMRKIDFIQHLNWEKLTHRQRSFFQRKFYEPLMAQLIGFWGNSRFVPNANMPVNVVTYDVNSSRRKHRKASYSNPSYDLRNALAQYVPGNSVVLDGRVSVVRGVRYHDYLAKKVVTFKTIYRNEQRTVIDAREEISNRIPWSVNNQEGLRMIQPTEFLPDTSETENRVIANPVFTRVNAQLIGASNWTSSANEPQLFSARSSKQSGGSEILYYNDGLGYGYAHCMDCGRIVMETKVAPERDAPLEGLPPDMNNREPRVGEGSRFHYKVGELNQYGKPEYCRGSRNPDMMQRNVVLADTILTDYTEIRLRYATDQKWLSNRRDQNGRLLTTLAILFAQALAEYLGKERDAFGFAVTPNGHLCIFDTNPGGAGYSNQLAQIEVMGEIIRASRRMVDEAIAKGSADMLLDKFTMRFAKDLDVAAARDWLALADEVGTSTSKRN